MRLWSISPSYLDKQGLCGLWLESLLAQSVLLKGEYTECPVCKGRGKFYDETPFNGRYSGVSNCWKCKCEGKIKTPYWGHPQLKRFKECERPLDAIGRYLLEIYVEAEVRGYKFDSSKIRGKLTPIKLTVTRGQIKFELEHLYKKLIQRKSGKAMEVRRILYQDCQISQKYVHPLFTVIEGGVEEWEKMR